MDYLRTKKIYEIDLLDLGLAKLLINITELPAGHFEGVWKLKLRILGKAVNKLCLELGRKISWMMHLGLVSWNGQILLLKVLFFGNFYRRGLKLNWLVLVSNLKFNFLGWLEFQPPNHSTSQNQFSKWTFNLSFQNLW